MTPETSEAAAPSKLFQFDQSSPNQTPPEPDAITPPQPRAADGRFAPKLTAQQKREAVELAGLDEQDFQELSPAEIRAAIREAKQEQRYATQNENFTRQLSAALRLRGDTVESPDAAPLEEPESAVPDFLDDAVKAYLQKQDARLKALEDKVGVVGQHIEGQVRQANESFNRRVERAFAKYPDIYGKGTLGKEVKEGTRPYFARMEAIAAYREAGSDPEQLEATIDTVVNERRGTKAPADDELDEDDMARRYARGEGVLGTPTSRGLTEEPPGKEKATQSVRRLTQNYQQNGGVPRTPKTEFLKH